MNLRNSHRVQWLPITLAVVGSITLAVGIWVALVTIAKSPSSLHAAGLSFQRAIYVGSNTCFTCHSQQQQEWSLMRYDNPIGDPIARSIVWDTAMRRIAVNGSANAYTKDGENQASSQVYSQRYIIKTEYGHVLLPT